MFSKRPGRAGESWPARRWSWVAPLLALAGMLLPLTGWQASAQLQSLGVAGSSADEGENEFPVEDEAGDSIDGDLEACLALRRSPRESLPPGFVAGTSGPLTAEGDEASLTRALRMEREAAACSAARLPLRC